MLEYNLSLTGIAPDRIPRRPARRLSNHDVQQHASFQAQSNTCAKHTSKNYRIIQLLVFAAFCATHPLTSSGQSRWVCDKRRRKKGKAVLANFSSWIKTDTGLFYIGHLVNERYVFRTSYFGVVLLHRSCFLTLPTMAFPLAAGFFPKYPQSLNQIYCNSHISLCIFYGPPCLQLLILRWLCFLSPFLCLIVSLSLLFCLTTLASVLFAWPVSISPRCIIHEPKYWDWGGTRGRVVQRDYNYLVTIPSYISLSAQHTTPLTSDSSLSCWHWASERWNYWSNFWVGRDHHAAGGVFG